MKNKELNQREKLLFSMVATLLVFIVGLTMNFKVISSNNGRMPVFSNYEMDDDQHFSFQDKSEVPYFYFGDIFLGHTTTPD